MRLALVPSAIYIQALPRTTAARRKRAPSRNRLAQRHAPSKLEGLAGESSESNSERGRYRRRCEKSSGENVVLCIIAREKRVGRAGTGNGERVNGGVNKEKKNGQSNNGWLWHTEKMRCLSLRDLVHGSSVLVVAEHPVVTNV